MPITILMPALSPTMEKGNVAKWLKKEGDKVAPGDVLAEIETDKATMEYEAVDDGVIARILVPEGTTDVAVNQPIAVLAVEGEDLKAAAARAGTSATPPAAPSHPAPPTPAPSSPPSPKTGRDEGSAAALKTNSAPQARSAESEPAAASTAASSPSPPSHPSPSSGKMAPQAPGGKERIFASPLARRLAKSAGIDVGRITGTGPHGRIIARDVMSATADGAALRPQAPAMAPSPAFPSAPTDDKIRALFEPGSYEVVPHDTMRRIIAQRLVQAKQTIPHFYLTVTCTIDKLLAAREDINATAPKTADGKSAYKLSVNDFIIKALAQALMTVPDANVTWTESGMLKHKHADIGVAVAIPGGLITPIIRKADTKSLITISNEMKDYATRARARRLKPEEYQGGTTAISNLGMYGVEEFAAVINPPHATIIAIGAGEPRPIVRDGQLAIATQMKATLSSDHRAVDGALGAELMAAFKRFVESPVMMLM